MRTQQKAKINETGEDCRLKRKREGGVGTERRWTDSGREDCDKLTIQLFVQMCFCLPCSQISHQFVAAAFRFRPVAHLPDFPQANMADTVPEDLEEKQRVSKSMMTNLTHDVDALRDTILRLSDRMEQLKTSSSPAKSDSPNRASAISSPAASLPFVTISIGDPQNHVDSFGSHTSYQVTTKVAHEVFFV